MTQKRGLQCKHGKWLMEAPPGTVDEPYPPMEFVDDSEWPCPEPECSRAAVEGAFDREAAEYEAERWAEYRAITGQ